VLGTLALSVGLLAGIGVCYTPWFHERDAAVPADG
jgi:hypothetical protein